MEVLLGILLAASVACNVWQYMKHRPPAIRRMGNDEQAAREYIAAISGMALGRLSEKDLARFKAGNNDVLQDTINDLLDTAISGHRQLRLLLAQYEQRVREHEVTIQMNSKTHPDRAASAEYRQGQAQEQVEHFRKILNEHYARAWRKLPPSSIPTPLAQ